MRASQRIAIVATMGLAIMAPRTIASEAGSAGALFLRVGAGARAAGMGEAFIAVPADASSLYWNPAAMAPVLGTNLLLEHNEFVVTQRLEQFMLSHEATWGTIGLGFTGRFGDEMELRESVPSAEPLGTFTSYDLAFLIGYSRYIVPNLSAGITVKPIYLRIYDVDAQGVGFDVGLFHVSQIKGLNLAATLSNIGAPMKFHDEEFALPRYAKVGAAYTRAVSAIDGGMLLTADAMFPNDGDARIHAGLEGNYQQRVFLRVGYKAGYDSQGMTFGLGIAARHFTVDYAFAAIGNDLGDGHRFSLGFTP